MPALCAAAPPRFCPPPLTFRSRYYYSTRLNRHLAQAERSPMSLTPPFARHHDWGPTASRKQAATRALEAAAKEATATHVAEDRQREAKPGGKARWSRQRQASKASRQSQAKQATNVGARTSPRLTDRHS